MSDYKWTPEQTTVLLEARERGLSSPKIADLLNAMFGTKYTRNSILGKAYRLRHAN